MPGRTCCGIGHARLEEAECGGLPFQEFVSVVEILASLDDRAGGLVVEVLSSRPVTMGLLATRPLTARCGWVKLTLPKHHGRASRAATAVSGAMVPAGCLSGVGPTADQSGLAVADSVVAEEVPHRGPLDPETPTRFGNAHSAVIADKTPSQDRIHKLLPILPIRGFGGQPGGHSYEFIPAVFKAPLSRHVRVDKPRIFLCVMGEQAERRIRVEPAGRVRAEPATFRQQRLTDNLPVAGGQEVAEPGVAR